MSPELRISSSPIFKFRVVVFTRTADALFPILPGILNFSADGALVDAWPYFPAIPCFKVGKMYLFFLFDCFFGVDHKSLRSTIIPELGV